MPSVFISYRRSDTDAAAQMLAQRLRDALGAEQVFIDTDIPAGADYKAHLASRLTEADRIIILMGETWLDTRDTEGARRLFKDDDVLRFEVESALRMDKCLPVLVSGATMPSPDALPDSIRALAVSNALPLRFDHDLDHHLERISRAARGEPTASHSRAQVPTAPAPDGRKWLTLGGITLGLVLVAGGLAYQNHAEQITACLAEWTRLHTAIDRGATTLRAQQKTPDSQRLANRLDAAAALLREQARVQCDQGAGGIPPDWRQRASRVELAIPAIEAAAQAGGAELTRLPGLVELVNASANPKAELQPLILAAATKRGVAAAKVMPLKLSAFWRCGSPVDRRVSCTQPPTENEERALMVRLNRTAHLYVLVYDAAGHFRIAYPSQPDQAPHAGGDLTIPANGWLKTGQETVLTIASTQRPRALEALIGAPQAPEDGALSKAARQALASLALSALDPAAKGRVAQVRVRP